VQYDIMPATYRVLHNKVNQSIAMDI
jgi:hypothetical protein